MVEVFITTIGDVEQSRQTTEFLTIDLPSLRFNVDMEQSGPGRAFPCGHTVLRVEGIDIDSDRIIGIVNALGFRCEVLADKICR